MIVFDTFAWIEYFVGSAKGLQAKKYVDSSDIILTPSVCLMEFKHKYLCEGVEWEQNVNFIIKRSKMVNITAEISLLTAGIKRQYKLYSVDALIYAVAVSTQLPLLTGDSHFKQLPLVEFIP